MKEKENWKVFDLAFEQQADIFELSKIFPKEELYSLTSQIRRSSRSVYSTLSEAYRKTKYPQLLILKLTDADSENSETSSWLDVAVSCRYIKEDEIGNLRELNLQIGKLLNYMMKNTGTFCFR
ncbi:MAG TPA: four helix bundle protein [Chitinophagaceae bacterium]|nr:four helix bundle protein [Chitinophagaceae bacterium]